MCITGFESKEKSCKHTSELLGFCLVCFLFSLLKNIFINARSRFPAKPIESTQGYMLLIFIFQEKKSTLKIFNKTTFLQIISCLLKRKSNHINPQHLSDSFAPFTPWWHYFTIFPGTILCSSFNSRQIFKWYEKKNAKKILHSFLLHI